MESEPAAPPPPPGRRSLPWLRFVVVAALVLLDLWSKSAVFEAVPSMEGTWDEHGHRRVPVLGDWLALMLSRNSGSAFGMFQDHPGMLVALRVVAIAVLGFLVWRAQRSQPVVLTALVLVLAGALGNLYDNLFLGDPDAGLRFGLVRDWIDVYFASFDWHFPTFNAADSCISVGAVLLLASGFLGRSTDADDPA